jgi:hypothetical protein
MLRYLIGGEEEDEPKEEKKGRGKKAAAAPKKPPPAKRGAFGYFPSSQSHPSYSAWVGFFDDIYFNQMVDFVVKQGLPNKQQRKRKLVYQVSPFGTPSPQQTVACSLTMTNDHIVTLTISI